MYLWGTVSNDEILWVVVFIGGESGFNRLLVVEYTVLVFYYLCFQFNGGFRLREGTLDDVVL